MRKLYLVIAVVFVFSSFAQITNIKGTWEYAGGISNGKPYAAPEGFTQQRKYTQGKFEAFLLEKGEKPVKYEAGSYTLKNDSCFEVQTYSLEPSVLTGKTVRYSFTVKNDTLFLKGKLPNGIAVEDYWKKVK